MLILPRRGSVVRSAELLLADGGSEIQGKFLLRPKGNTGNEFILSVIYKGAATHHTVSRDSEGEELSINNQPAGGATTLDEVRTILFCSVVRRAETDMRIPLVCKAMRAG